MPSDQQTATIVSLGWRCEVAWQIRQFYRQDEAYPFDWLVTPFQALVPMIEEDFAAIADPHYLRVASYGNGSGWTVENTRYQVLLHHDFDRLPDGRIAPNWQDKLEQVNAKFDYLRRRWIKLLDGAGPICFVRRQGNMQMPGEQPQPTERAHYLSLLAAMSRRAPRARLSYLFCDCPDVPVADIVMEADVGSGSSADWPMPEDLWKGRTPGYRTAFSQILRPVLSGRSGRRLFVS